LSGRGLCDELITRPEEAYRLCCVVVCGLETSRMCAPYIYDISSLRVNFTSPDVFHNYHKIYIFVQHIYNFLQSIHRLHVSALLPSSGLIYEQVPYFSAFWDPKLLQRCY